MYGAVVPFWLYGAGFLQREHGYSINRAGTLMLIPELALCALSVPIGVAVDRFHLTFARCQRWYALGAFTIAASHLGLGLGGDPNFFVLTLGTSYACCNQLTWASFPGVCPKDLMSLGGGVVACCINLACAIVHRVPCGPHPAHSVECESVGRVRCWFPEVRPECEWLDDRR